MIRDARYAIRLLRRDAGTSALIILVLALGIGGNAAMFTLLKKALVDPLPYPDSERLVTVVDSIPDKRLAAGVNVLNPTASVFLAMRDRSRVLEQLSGIDHRDFHLNGADEPLSVIGARVTDSFFSLLGVHPSLGRTFGAEEQVVILTDGFWRIRMGADPAILGKTLRLNGAIHVIVGVLPRDFDFEYPGLRLPGSAEIYVPLPIEKSPEGVRVLARIRSGFTPADAAADLDRITHEVYTPEYLRPGGGDTDRTLRPVLLREAIIGNQRSLLLMLMAGVGVLLLIACANTVQILLARSLQRSREVAIRAALGANRSALVRQFLIEAFMLAAFAGVLGLVFARWIVRLVIVLFPSRNPLLESAHIDLYVGLFTVSISFVSALAFGIVPAINSSLWTLSPKLNTRTPIGHGNRWRHAMIAIEAALSVVLLCGAGLITHNLWSLISTPLGFDPGSISIVQLRMTGSPDQRKASYQQYIEQITAIPGVNAASVATSLPLRPGNGGFNKIVGDPPDAIAHSRPAWTYFVSPDYFRVLGIPLIAGRTFRTDDTTGRPLVIVVNREFVRSHGLGPDAIGRQIDDGPSGYITIVGVVDDVRIRGTETSPEPQLYMSYLQFYQPGIYILVRSTLPRVQLIARIKTAIRASNADQPILNATTMNEVFSNSISGPRFTTILIGAFALLALLIAATGMYSVISCLVSQRTSEIALRIALGAGRSSVVRTVLSVTMRWVMAGLVIGIALAVAGAGTISRLSNTTAPASPVVYAAVLLLFVIVTLAATVRPLRRATHLDPMIALKSD